jgi:hypothetical protein
MNGNNKKVLAIVIVGSVAILVFVLNWMRSEANLSQKLKPLLQPSGQHMSVNFGSGEEYAAFQHRRVEFESIWKARHERDVAAEILPFLSDPAEGLRSRAVHALGHLESTEAEAPLQALLDKSAKARGLQYDQVRGVNVNTVRLALSRIHTRDVKGEQRIAAIAKAMGLTLAELVGLSQRVNSKQGRYSAGMPGDRIIEEVVDVLYTMTRRGENTSGIVRRLTLNAAQRVKLEAGALPPQQEAEMLIDYLQQCKVITGDEYELVPHLVQLGAEVSNQAISRVEQMKRNPNLFNGSGYKILLLAAAETKGTEILPLLRQLEEQSTDKWVPRYAQQVRQQIEREEAMRRGDPKAFSVPGYIVDPKEALALRSG